MFGSLTDDARLAKTEAGGPVISFLVPLVPAKGSCRVLDKKKAALGGVPCVAEKKGLVGDGNQ